MFRAAAHSAGHRRWSVGLLDEDERSLLEIVGIFVDG